MSVRNQIVSSVLMILLCGGACVAAPTAWLDRVVSFDRPAGSSNDGGPASNALGPSDGLAVSVDIPETLIVAFAAVRAADGDGADLKIYEHVNGDSQIDVYGSKDNSTYVLLGRINGDATFDLSAYPGLEYVNFLKFVGLDDGGSSAGFELDAVEALHPVPAPGAILLGTLGAGLVGWLRRRRTL